MRGITIHQQCTKRNSIKKYTKRNEENLLHIVEKLLLKVI